MGPVRFEPTGFRLFFQARMVIVAGAFRLRDCQNATFAQHRNKRPVDFSRQDRIAKRPVAVCDLDFKPAGDRFQGLIR